MKLSYSAFFFCMELILYFYSRMEVVIVLVWWWNKCISSAYIWFFAYVCIVYIIYLMYHIIHTSHILDLKVHATIYKCVYHSMLYIYQLYLLIIYIWHTNTYKCTWRVQVAEENSNKKNWLPRHSSHCSI